MSEQSLPSRDLTFRHELKYIISYPEKELLCARLKGLLQQDAHAVPKGYYSIRSLYFDDIWNSSYEEKMMGVGDRFKYRIRTYPDGDRNIHLEKKIKRGNLVSKQMANLSSEDARRILAGDYQFLLKSDQELCRHFYCDCTTGLYRPRVMIDYEREPFVFAAGDVRITFDTNIRAGVWGYDLFDLRMPMVNTMDPGLLILEVKYTELLPNMIRSALPTHSGELTAVSKYVLGCDSTAFAAR